MTNKKIYYFFEDQWIHEMDSDDEVKEVEIVLNSRGGDHEHTYAIIDAIENMSKLVTITATGTVMSGAFMVLMSGNHRRVTKNCILMSHKPIRQMNRDCYGVDAIYVLEKNTRLIEKKQMLTYMKYTGLPQSKVRKQLLRKEDFYMQAEYALKYNVVDEIIGEENE